MPTENAVTETAPAATPEVVATPATEIKTETAAPAAKDPLRPSLEEIAAQMAMAQGKKEAPGAVSETSTDPAPETVADPAPAQPAKKPDPQSARFAALARREQEARRREAEASQRVREIENRQKELADREAKIKAAKSPLEILKAHGFKYEDATMEAVGAFKPKEPDPLDVKLQGAVSPISTELEAMKNQLAEATKLLKEYQADKLEAIKHQVMKDFQSAATEGGYEYTIAFGQEALNLARDIALEHKQKFGRLLTYQESLDIVEAHYEKKAKALLGTKKLQGLMTPTATPSLASSTQTKPSVSAKQSETKPASKTLTQSHSQATRAKPDIDKMSTREALDYIAANVLSRPG